MWPRSWRPWGSRCSQGSRRSRGRSRWKAGWHRPARSPCGAAADRRAPRGPGHGRPGPRPASRRGSTRESVRKGAQWVPIPGRYRAWTEVYVDLSIATSRQDEVVMLSVAGDVDLATGQQLEREIAEAVDTAGPAGVVVDLGGVGFLDSSGISVLVK